VRHMAWKHRSKEAAQTKLRQVINVRRIEQQTVHRDSRQAFGLAVGHVSLSSKNLVSRLSICNVGATKQMSRPVCSDLVYSLRAGTRARTCAPFLRSERFSKTRAGTSRAESSNAHLCGRAPAAPLRARGCACVGAHCEPNKHPNRTKSQSQRRVAKVVREPNLSRPLSAACRRDWV
jgi:hypothetical protein